MEQPTVRSKAIPLNSTANAAVQAAIDRAIRDKGEIGVQVAAYLDGELVVDAWGGLADPSDSRRVDGDTLFNVFSVAKGVVATALHVQAERGLVDYETPVAQYWPEYGCRGKENVTVRDALSHRTGTPQMPAGTTPESLCDWDSTAAAIADLQPIFTVGQPAYQSISFGWVIGEIVRRTDPKRRSFRDFVLQEICAPYRIQDLWLGIPGEVEARIARLIDGTAHFPAPPEESLLAASIPNSVRLIPEVFERPDVRRACIAAVGGIFNARSEARFWAILAGGGELDGKRLLSQARVDMACEKRQAAQMPDPVYFNTIMPISQGGFWLYDAATSFTCPVKAPRGICSPGAGASLGWADPDTGLAVAFCHNYMSAPMRGEDHPAYEIANVIRESLGLS